jgi:hypothetical protein
MVRPSRSAFQLRANLYNHNQAIGRALAAGGIQHLKRLELDNVHLLKKLRDLLLRSTGRSVSRWGLVVHLVEPPRIRGGSRVASGRHASPHRPPNRVMFTPRSARP